MDTDTIGLHGRHERVVSVSQCREILGGTPDDHTDADILRLRCEMYALADVVVQIILDNHADIRSLSGRGGEQT